MTDALADVRAHLVKTDGESPSLEAACTTQLHQYEGLTVDAVEAAAAGEDLTALSGASSGLRALVANFQAEDGILPESTTLDESGRLPAFRDGRVLFMRNWPFAYNVLAADPSLPPPRGGGRTAARHDRGQAGPGRTRRAEPRGRPARRGRGRRCGDHALHRAVGTRCRTDRAVLGPETRRARRGDERRATGEHHGR